MTIRTYESLPTAAARIGVSVKTIRRRIAEGVPAVYRCGRILGWTRTTSTPCSVGTRSGPRVGVQFYATPAGARAS